MIYFPFFYCAVDGVMQSDYNWSFIKLPRPNYWNGIPLHCVCFLNFSSLKINLQSIKRFVADLVSFHSMRSAKRQRVLKIEFNVQPHSIKSGFSSVQFNSDRVWSFKGVIFDTFVCIEELHEIVVFSNRKLFNLPTTVWMQQETHWLRPQTDWLMALHIIL